MARKSRRLTAEEREIRRRIARYCIRQWRRYQNDEPGAKQSAFAAKLNLDAGTVSKIINEQVDGAGLNVAIALVFRGGVDAQSLFRDDPVIPQLEPIPRAIGEPASQRLPARRAGSNR